MTLSDTIARLSPGLSRIQPRAIYWIFIPCDLLSIVFQAVGTGMSAKPPSSGDADGAARAQLGVHLALFGLAFQLFALTMFLAFFADYLVRYFRAGRAHARAHARDGRQQQILGPRAKAFVGFLALATLLMVVRAGYRLYELRDGFRGNALKQEAPFIGIEGV